MKTYEGFFDADDRNGGLRVTGPDGLKELLPPGFASWGRSSDGRAAYQIVKDAYDGEGSERAEEIADEYYDQVHSKLIKPMNPDEPMVLSWYDVTGLVNELIQRDSF